MNLSRVPVPSYPALGTAVQERVHVHAGTVYVTSSSALITTLVSSSVAVCMWSPEAAGVAHYVVPVAGSEPSLHYGYHALTILRDRLRSLGVRDEECMASIFGGAEGSSGRLGRRNVAVARDFFMSRAIPVVREETGGKVARRVTFSTFDGTAVTRPLLLSCSSRDRETNHDNS